MENAGHWNKDDEHDLSGVSGCSVWVLGFVVVIVVIFRLIIGV